MNERSKIRRQRIIWRRIRIGSYIVAFLSVSAYFLAPPAAEPSRKVGGVFISEVKSDKVVAPPVKSEQPAGGLPYTTLARPVSVPEPGSILLLAPVAILLFRRSRRLA
jgi:hypothetical protein